MSWSRMDDSYGERPDLVRAGAIAFCVATWSISYCARHLTDGVVSFEALKGCPWVSKKSALDRACEALEVAGFWSRFDDGFEIVDPFQYLQKSDDVREKRAANARRQAEWRERQQRRRNGVRNGVTDEVRNAPPDPTPGRVAPTGATPTEGAPAAAPPPRSAPAPPPARADDIEVVCPWCRERLVDDAARAEHVEAEHVDELRRVNAGRHWNAVLGSYVGDSVGRCDFCWRHPVVVAAYGSYDDGSSRQVCSSCRAVATIIGRCVDCGRDGAPWDDEVDDFLCDGECGSPR